MVNKFVYVDKEALAYTVKGIKEYMASHYVTKDRIGEIETVLDNINGEVVSNGDSG